MGVQAADVAAPKLTPATKDGRKIIGAKMMTRNQALQRAFSTERCPRNVNKTFAVCDSIKQDGCYIDVISPLPRHEAINKTPKSHHQISTLLTPNNL